MAAKAGSRLVVSGGGGGRLIRRQLPRGQDADFGLARAEGGGGKGVGSEPAANWFLGSDTRSV